MKKQSESADTNRMVLVLEDNIALGDLLVSILSRGGFEVILARTAGDVLALSPTQKASINLMIADLSIPGPQNGFTIAKGLRGENPGLKIIFTSGFSIEELGEASFVEKKNFLQKPFLSSELLRMVKEVLTPPTT